MQSEKQLIFKLQQNEANSEENSIGLGLGQNNKRTWFDYVSKTPQKREISVDQFSEQPYFYRNTPFQVQFELDTEVLHHDRSIYTFLDLLGDVGGLFDALSGISSVIVFLYFTIFGNPMHEYLLKALFMRNPKD